MVSALESSVEAFNTGGSQNGWTTDPLASFVGRLCGATPDGFYVVPEQVAVPNCRSGP